MFSILAVQILMAIMVRTCMSWSMIATFQTVFQNGGYKP